MNPLALGVVFLAALVVFGAFALLITLRNVSDNRAAASARRARPARLPRNFNGGWDRLDEHGRPW